MISPEALMLLLLAGTVGIAQAETDTDTDPDGEGDLPSVLSVDASVAGNSGRSFFANIDVAISHGVRASVGGGDSFSANDRTETQTSTYHIGLTTDPAETVVAGLDFERWGRPDVLTTETRRVDFSLTLQDWTFGFSPARYIVNVYSEEPRRYQLTGDVYSLSVACYSPVGWFVEAGYTEYVYLRDFRVAAFRAYFANLLDSMVGLSPETFELLTVLDDNQRTFSTGMIIGDDMLGIDWVRSNAVYESTSHTTISIYYEKYMTDQWGATLRFGEQKSDNIGDDALRFGVVNLKYFW